jgi:TPR repeat protein
LDYAEALKWYRLAAEQGHVQAQSQLGFMYDIGNIGQGVPPDPAEGMKWYRLAAEQGDADAQLVLGLGLMYCFSPYCFGLQDYAQGLKWLRLAAEQGNLQAQINLGALYRDGQGVLQDYAEAAKWYRLAAEQGAASAQFNLGAMYADGHGVPQDYVLAHMWFNLAAAQSDMNFKGVEAQTNKYAFQQRDAVAAKMTPDQIAEAQRLAREWKPTRK